MKAAPATRAPAAGSDAAAQFERDGFTILRDAVAPDVVRDVDAALRPWFDVTPHGRGDFEGTSTQRVYNLIAKIPAVWPLALHDGVLELVRGRLVPAAQLSIAQAVRILPGETEQALHTDDLPFPIPKPHQPVVVNAMWAITAFTRANGATRLVPGSQAAGEPPPEDDCVFAEMEPGSVLVWDGSLFHGGGANATDGERIGVTINYNASWLRQQENQYLAVPREVVLQMPQELRRLIGYELFGVLGVIDGVHPLKSL
ncbi:MAG: phytanoyl-CoA dioxygenase [Actinobacteria bacterium]|nr:MAG: phytanoyl-CoA dioxygenase [Actinomycetota bacterium]